MARAKKRADGRYQRSVTVGHKDGRPIRKTVYGKTLRELDAAYRDLMTSVDRGVLLKQQGLRVGELVRMWFDTEVRPNIRPTTIRKYNNIIKSVDRWIGEIAVKDLSVTDVERVRSHYDVMGHRPAFNTILSALKRALDWAEGHEIVLRNVARRVAPLSYAPRQRRALTDREVALIMTAKLSPVQRAFVDVLFYTGMRRGEALALTRADVDFKLGRIVVNKSLAGETKTPAGVRMIPMPRPLVETLAAYLKELDGELLFPNGRGNPMAAGSFYPGFWGDIKAGIFGLSENAPEDFSPHLFRHNYASDLYKAGVDVKTAQYLLGHASPSTTLGIYTHLSGDDIHVDALDAYYSQKAVRRSRAI